MHNVQCIPAFLQVFSPQGNVDARSCAARNGLGYRTGIPGQGHNYRQCSQRGGFVGNSLITFLGHMTVRVLLV